ncbi:MAG: M20/M25/M40 family metallo-hydrolase [Chloroflexota bacterium]|nr:M20/M25/M40 family metallo-hydrolase [Chloroflexota bacterium]
MRETAERRGLGLQLDLGSSEEPVLIDELVRASFGETVRALGLPIRRLLSYAGHGGSQMATVGPIGMLFVPSKDGRSPCPEEWTDLADLALGAQALGEVLLRFDAHPAAGRRRSYLVRTALRVIVRK